MVNDVVGSCGSGCTDITTEMSSAAVTGIYGRKKNTTVSFAAVTAE